MSKAKQQVLVIVKALSSRSNSDRQPSPIQAQPKNLPSRPAHWKTIFFMVSPLVLASCFAIGHYVLFKYLDGRPVDNGTLRQSWVTTISLLLVTAVRVCLVGCVGMCFAQHLWRVLRETALPIFRIEQLFCIRSNPLVLANPRVAWTTPLLFTMAIYIWFIELAAVYPPGALTVDARPFLNVTEVETAVINQPLEKIVAPWEANITYPLNYIGDVNNSPTNSMIFAGYGNPLRSITALSKFILFTGRIVDLKPPAGQNVSYSMAFRAPQVSCAETVTNITTEDQSNLPGSLEYIRGTIFNASYDPELGRPENENMTIVIPYPFQAVLFDSGWDNNETLTIRQIRWFGGYLDEVVQQGNGTESGGEGERAIVFAGEQKDLNCKAKSMQYSLNLTYHDGVQYVNYATSDPQPLFKYDDGSMILRDGSTVRNETKAEEFDKEFNEWPIKLRTALESWNMFAEIDATLANMNYTWQLISSPLFDKSAGTFKLANGTEVPLFDLDRRDQLGLNGSDANIQDPTLLQDSAFDLQRFNNSLAQNSGGRVQKKEKDFFDPRTLDINEFTLNALLSNTTISMLSLGIQKATIPVNISDYRNTYQFSDSVSFFVPYALCIGIALFYVIIGIWALVSNGVPATDGGFLQIMMATRGRTEMEKLVLKEGIVGTGDLSKELLNMKVRFGELVQDDAQSTGLRRAVTFGTVSETSPLTPVRRKNTFRSFAPFEPVQEETSTR